MLILHDKKYGRKIIGRLLPGRNHLDPCGYHCFFFVSSLIYSKGCFFAPPKISLSVKLWQWLFHFEGRSWTSVHRKPGVLNCPPLTLFWGERHLVRLVVVEPCCGDEVWLRSEWINESCCRGKCFFFELAAFVFLMCNPIILKKLAERWHMTNNLYKGTLLYLIWFHQNTWSSFRFSWPWWLLNSIFVDGKHQNITISTTQTTLLACWKHWSPWRPFPRK